MKLKLANSKNTLLDTVGFTLLEVLISMAILVFISFAIYQATTETYKLRDILSLEGNFYNSIRLSMSIMQRDISLIYSPLTIKGPQKKIDTNTSLNNPQMGTVLSDDLGQTTTFWSSAIDTTGLRPSRLIGSDNKISFIALSHLRIYKDSPESEFSKITYEVKEDSSNTDHPKSLVLVKTESSNAFSLDDSKDSFSHSYEILHGIKSIQYIYYQRDGNTWKIFKSWDTEKEDTKNIFPDIIDVKIDVFGPKNQIFEGRYKFRPEIPLNGLKSST